MKPCGTLKLQFQRDSTEVANPTHCSQDSRNDLNQLTPCWEKFHLLSLLQLIIYSICHLTFSGLQILRPQLFHFRKITSPNFPMLQMHQHINCFFRALHLCSISFKTILLAYCESARINETPQHVFTPTFHRIRLMHKACLR